MLLLGIADAALIEGLPKEKIEDIAMDAIKKPPIKQLPNDSIPKQGVRRNQGADVQSILQKQKFTIGKVNEKVILEKIIPSNDTNLQSYVLLKDGDRAGLIAWTTSSKVKEYYLTLKEALHNAFTSEVKDLLDETQRREGRPTRNLLTFFDPGILSERVVFIRVRERLYEFHVTEGSSEAIFNLIEELTK